MDGNGNDTRVYTALFVFCGVGGGALGFQRARVQLRGVGVSACFRVLGGSKDDQREKVGDAVPVTSAEAIGTQVLLTLVHADEGIFALSSGGAVWVRQRGAQRELVIEGTALQ